MDMDKSKTTVICPENDLESKTIIEIAQTLGMDVRVSKQDWGARLGNENSTFFSNLKENVVVVEMPDIKKEQELENAGHTLEIIDPHIYKIGGKHLDLSNELSSIEQFANLFNYQLTAHERLVALNDTGYIGPCFM